MLVHLVIYSNFYVKLKLMFSLFVDYTKWHYSQALFTIVELAQEFTRFFLNLFSVALFLKSLFSPIFSIPVNGIGTSEVSDKVAAFVGGVLTILVGAFFRLLLILLGLLCSLLSIVFFTLVLLFWVSIPAVLPLLIYTMSIFYF